MIKRRAFEQLDLIPPPSTSNNKKTATTSALQMENESTLKCTNIKVFGEVGDSLKG